MMMRESCAGKHGRRGVVESALLATSLKRFGAEAFRPLSLKTALPTAKFKILKESFAISSFETAFPQSNNEVVVARSFHKYPAVESSIRKT